MTHDGAAAAIDVQFGAYEVRSAMEMPGSTCDPFTPGDIHHGSGIFTRGSKRASAFALRFLAAAVKFPDV